MNQIQLGVLSALVVVLAAAVALDRPHAPRAREEARVLAGLTGDAITRIALADATLVRGSDEALGFEGGGAVEPEAVRELVGALETIAERGRVPAGDAATRGLEPPASTITVAWGGRDVTLRLGGPAPGGRRWIASSAAPGVHLLVDDHQARALMIGRDALRRRRAFVAPDAGPIEITRAGAPGLVIEAPARGDRCVRLGGGCARADESALAALVARLGALRLVGGDGAAAGVPPTLTVQAGGETLAIDGPCPGDPAARRASGAPGVGCVPETEAAALEALAADPTRLVDRAPWRAREDVTRLVISDGTRRVEIDVGSQDVSRQAVEAWLAALGATRARAVLVSSVPLRVTLEITSPGATSRLELIGPAPGGGLLVRRAGEPVALVVHEDAARFFALDPAPFGDPTLLAFEPSALRAIETDVETAARGASMEDWTLTRPVATAVDTEALGRLREAASQLTARWLLPRGPRELGAPPPGRARRLVFVLDPPPTAPTVTGPVRLTLELGGAAPGGGCLARAEGRDGVIDDEDCDALREHLARPVLVPDPEHATVVAVTVAGHRWEQGAGRWLAAGLPASPRDERRLEALLAALAAPVGAAGYGRATGLAVRLELEGRPPIELVVGRGEASLATGGVRVALPLALCETWPETCR